jgi:outer membrane protein OmpA-like peptidoglycan-associated protein
MTPSSTSSQTSDLPKQRLTKRPSPGRSFLTLIFRLLLLGISGSLAALLGIVIAQFYPGQIQEPPLVEKFMQGSQSLWQSVSRLPQTWSSRPTPPSSAVPATNSPTPPQTSATPQLPAPPEPLSESDRQRLQAELTQLQTELQQATDRSAALASIQQRLQAIQQQLDPNAAPGSSAQPVANQNLVASTSTLSHGELLKVTLPSDALFNADQVTLRPTTPAILDSIVTD